MNGLESQLCCSNCGVLPENILESYCCSTLYCVECSKVVNKCPTCGNYQSLPPNLPLQTLISKIEVGCQLGCGKRMKLSQRKNHEDNECLNKPVVCPSGCGQQVKLADLTTHQATCFQVCEYAEFGCNTQIRNLGMEQHLKDEQEKHLKLMSAVVKNQNQKIKELEQKLKEPPKPHLNLNQLKGCFAEVATNCATNCQPVCDRLLNCAREVASTISIFQAIAAILFILHFLWLPHAVQFVIIVLCAIAAKKSFPTRRWLIGALIILCVLFLGRLNLIFILIFIPLVAFGIWKYKNRRRHREKIT